MRDPESQSPSILDYSPTDPTMFKHGGVGRSPHQFWTTLLRLSASQKKMGHMSQSPSILDYSPTLMGTTYEK
jgi:hypothetical protein